MTRFSLLFILAVCTLYSVTGQMPDGKYGNEWIDHSQSYYKIPVAEDGIFRISQQQLLSAGVPVSSIRGDQLQLFYMGQEIPIYTTTANTLGSNGYIEFYGEKNRSKLDRHLFQNPDAEMLNPNYSLFTDTSAYFLTWSDTPSAARYAVTNNNLSGLPAKESYFIYKSSQLFTEASANDPGHVKRTINSDGGAYSYFDVAEGFSSGFANSQTANIEASQAQTTVAQSQLLVRFASDNGLHETTVNLNGTQLISETYSGYQVKDYTFDVSTSDIAGGAEVRVDALTDNTDRIALAEVSLLYPRAFNFDNTQQFIFEIEQSGGVRYLEIENFDAGGADPVLYDITNGLRIVGKLEGGVVRVALPPSSQNRQLILVNNNGGAIGAGTPKAVSFIDYSQQDAEFIIISHQKLMNDGQGQNFVQQYATYRNSQQGGGYTTSIVEIQQLYDQFAYGINRHPLAIRNFGHYIHTNWQNPRYVFLIGKGRTYDQVRRSADLNNPDHLPLLIPTYGKPGSDVMLMGETQIPTPRIPIGRIATNSAREVDLYLRKVKEFEANANLPQTIGDKWWMKNLIHLGGGGPSEQALIRNYLEQMEAEIENNRFGGKVSAFYKTSSDPVQISTSERIFDRINDGVSMITFFGHSGVNAFDFNIDNPDNYENKGKYPLMFSLGCFIGNIHTSFQGISERFTFNEDKGAIGFGASTSLGFPSALRSFMLTYYKLLGGELYGFSLGDIHKEALARLATNSAGLKELLQQFTIHGDPSLHLNPHPGPDYVVDASSVRFEPSVVTAQLDSFDIVFDVVNIGQHVVDSITIKIEQRLPSGQQQTMIVQKTGTPAFKSVQQFRMPSFGKQAVGLNTFFVSIDTENKVDELPAPDAELNNELRSNLGSLGKDLYIADNSVTPIFPQNFGIVNAQDVTLKASTGNALAPERKYIIQLDTTELFNSLFKKQTEITQLGGVIEWQPNVPMEEETVYYWRISPDSTSAEVGYLWESSSFVYLPNSSEGWNQSHYFQYLDNEFEGLEIDSVSRNFKFWVNGFFIQIINKVNEPNSSPAYIYNLGHAAASVRPWLWLNSGIAIVVGDSISGSGWVNPSGGLYGSVNSGTTRVFAFPTTTQEQRKQVMDFLITIVPNNNYVFLFTVLKDFDQDYTPEQWAADSLTYGTNIFQILEAEGAQLVRQLENKGSVPYSFVYQKGKNNVFGETIADNKNETINTEVFIPILRDGGSIESTIIGPAFEWESSEWQYNNIDAPTADSIFLSVFGIGANNQEDLLKEKLTNASIDLSDISATDYPFLRFELNLKDAELRTPIQLEYWRVLYKSLPESAVNPVKLLTFQSDSLQQGETFKFETVIENISHYDMDSMLVKFTTIASDNQEAVQYSRIAPLPQGDTLSVRYQTNTSAMSGIQRFFMEVNPDEDQAELHHFNNFAIGQFFVEEDLKNPLLDVTFDGIHILDGDIVSPKPDILISLKDENPYLPLSDTALFRIYLEQPDGSTRRINFDNQELLFFPSTDSKNRATVEFRPTLDVDGAYQLLVQAEDATGNQSGDLDYKVSFEVINKKSLSNIFNYPNPFSTSTQFVYTLTGDEPPEYFKIQILTVSGKIVREITQNELGPLKIGIHRTAFRWDGTDEYGHRLANGVYLYRIVAKDRDGKDFDLFNSGADKFFRNKFGKMVILR